LLPLPSPHASCVFTTSFAKSFVRQKDKLISDCLPGSSVVRRRRHFNHDGYVLSGFYKVLSFTKKQFGSVMIYASSLEKQDSNFALLLKSRENKAMK